MVSINLFPWREQLRIYQIKSTRISLLASIVVPIFFWISGHAFLSHHENVLQEEVAELKQKISDATNLQALAQEKMRIHQEKKHSHDAYGIEKLLLNLGRKSAHQVCFNKITRNKNSIFFTGWAPSAANFTAFLQAWQTDYRLAKIKIVQNKQQENGRIQFHFQAQEIKRKAQNEL